MFESDLSIPRAYLPLLARSSKVNKSAKFTTYIFNLGIACLRLWLRIEQYGDLAPSPQTLDEDGSFPADADLFPVDLNFGMAKQGAEEYASLGCVTCHTQQVRRVETGFDT